MAVSEGLLGRIKYDVNANANNGNKKSTEDIVQELAKKIIESEKAISIVEITKTIEKISNELKSHPGHKNEVTEMIKELLDAMKTKNKQEMEAQNRQGPEFYDKDIIDKFEAMGKKRTFMNKGLKLEEQLELFLLLYKKSSVMEKD